MNGRSPHLATLRPYVPADPPGIVHRLDANEAPPLESARLRDIARAAFERVALERYPDARAAVLRDSLGRWTGASPSDLVVGTGSDELIALLFEAWSRPPEGAAKPVVLLPAPTFVMYRVNAVIRGWDVVEVPAGPDWRLDLPAMLEACERHRPNLVFLATPNNPTGQCVSPAEVDAIARACPWGLVVVDEAYLAFSSAPRAARSRDNIVRMGTVSKIGLAALRLGWIEAAAEVATAVDVARAPFNTSATSQAVVAALLDEGGSIIREHCAHVASERARVAAALSSIGGVKVHPSEANFLWVEPRQSCASVWESLVSKGVLVRSFASHPGRIASGLRVSIGSRAASDALLEAWPR